MPKPFFVCHQCGEGADSINHAIRLIRRVGRDEEQSMDICDSCLDSLTGNLIGPCHTCDNIYSILQRSEVLDDWNCESCTALARARECFPQTKWDSTIQIGGLGFAAWLVTSSFDGDVMVSTDLHGAYLSRVEARS